MMKQETRSMVRQANANPDTNVKEVHTNQLGQRQTQQKEQLKVQSL